MYEEGQESAADRTDLIGVVLAAGKGTRMRSEVPKVLHQIAGRPMLAWVLDSVRAAKCSRILIVVGHGAETVREQFPDDDLEWIEQTEQRGTGHALAQVEASLGGAAELLVVSGDVPLVSAGTLRELVERAVEGWGSMAVAELADPGSLGRVIRTDTGSLERIVEAADATLDVLEVPLINAGLYVLPAPDIFDRLRQIDSDNAQGEVYLTDALGAAAADGQSVVTVDLENPAEAAGINDRLELADAHRYLIDFKLMDLALSGVTILEPERTTIEPGVEVGRDTVIHPDVSLLGATRIGSGCELHQGCWIRNSEVSEGAVVRPYSVLEGSVVGVDCQVGPFSRLRPGSVLEKGARTGNFVEVKNARLRAGVKAGHLAYLGDADIGEGANIGAGTITCNYDGEKKHATEIGAGAFIGSDTMLVAPVTVGEDAITGAGSVITSDVPDGALAVERSRQRNIEGWAVRRRKQGQAVDDSEEES